MKLSSRKFLLLAIASISLLAVPAIAQNASQFVLKYAADAPGPSVNAYTAAHNAWMEEVEWRSNGRIKFQRFYAQSLVPSAEQLQAVTTGVADVAPILSSFWPAKIPLSNVGWQPGVITDSWAGMMALRDLIKSHPAFKKELEDQNNVKYVAGASISPYGIISKSRIAKLDDLKGVTIITLGGSQSDWLKALGGVPVFPPSPDRYDALQKGTVQAIVAQPVSVAVFKYEEVAKFFYEIELGAGAQYIAMNLDTWKKLPRDLQIIIEELEPYSIEQAALKFQYEGAQKMIDEKMKPAGVQFTSPTPDDLRRSKEVAKAVAWEKWISANEARGLPGREIFEKFISLYQKYEAESPFKGKFKPSVLN